ncbi:hypothetical protein [Paenibacillus naphthalenovorans]|uniref:DUF2190 domain-containing protein n=1 Tax=Paenibacillus naphthalenovorans TaxID=162209 RepID=A0A0U2W789_9BACL|nr:hypothetical protein [Paenibacillus naphthalenovorans]ALS22302.1 hypothetical protein IJ22_19280 [Paenibacillus naphthalenovorans]
MLRNIITGSKVTEIYKVSADLKRGSVVTKNLSTGKAEPADGEGVQIYFLDKDNQPQGHLSDVEISQYDSSLDTVKANELGVLVKPIVGTQWATDQVSGTFSVGDYAVAGTAANKGKLIKAVATKVSTLKYVGTYDDAGHTLYQFEVVNPFTVA